MTGPGPARDPDPPPRWVLTLYVSGASPRSAESVAALRTICDEDLGGDVDLTILDAADHPQRVVEDQIVAVPTLVKHAPAPRRHLVGNLSDLDRVRFGLGIPPPDPARAGRHRPGPGVDEHDDQ